MRRHIGLALLTAALSVLLTGCLFRSTEDLYALPERFPGYEDLTGKRSEIQAGLEMEYGTTVETAVIYSGDNTSVIQFQDMDGDGSQETAVISFRIPGAERSLRVYFLTTQGDTERYEISAVVEGDGTGINAIDYVELSGSGKKEVVVSWQMSTGVYLLGAYSLEEAMVRSLQYAASAPAGSASAQGLPDREALRATEWMTTVYDNYALYDLDQDTRTELAVVRVDKAGTNSAVDLYGWRDGSFMVRASAPLSMGISSVEKNGVETNFLKEDGDVPVRALYISSELADGHHVVDVVAYQDGNLKNLSLDETGVSREMLDRYVDLEPTDVNGDGVLELPTPVPLPNGGDTSASDFWLIDWSQYSSTGKKMKVCTTYHNVADGWYLIVPEEWKDQITLRRRDSIGQRSVIFYHLEGEGEEPTPFLVIYKFTSQFDRADASNRFILREEEGAVYAAAVYDSGWELGMSDADLQTAFHLIQSSWSD